MLLPLFHLSVFSINAFSLWYDQQYVDLPLPAKGYQSLPFKARLMFITIWCLILQTVYFLVSFLNDLAGSNEPSPKKRPLLRLLKDTLFGLAFALALHVGVNFWCLYYVDRELVFPVHFAKNFPSWLNHVQHSLIVLFISLELLFANKTYPTRKIGVTLAVTFFVSYLVWMHYNFERTGAWPYPVLKVLNLPARIVFLAVSVSFGLGIYILGEKLNSIVCPSPKKQVEDGKKKKR